MRESSWWRGNSLLIQGLPISFKAGTGVPLKALYKPGQFVHVHSVQLTRLTGARAGGHYPPYTFNTLQHGVGFINNIMEARRKITREVVGAFMRKEKKRKGNTESTGRLLYLHGHAIACWDGDRLLVSAAGWKTETTKERLNGLPGVNIQQKNFSWYLNGEEWSGNWTEVEPQGSDAEAYPLGVCSRGCYPSTRNE